METNHLPHLISLVVSKDFYDELPEEDQKILIEAQEIAREYSREASDKRISQRIKTIEESGTQIITLDDETRQAMIDASAAIYEDIRESVDPGIYEAYMGDRD